MVRYHYGAVAALCIAMSMGCATAESAGEPLAERSAAEWQPEDATKVLRAMPPARRYDLGRQALVDLRVAVARIRGRVEGLRETVRERDPRADFEQLVCLEERMGSVDRFATRGEHAYDAFADALNRDDLDRAGIRLRSLVIAREGIEAQITEARGCSGPVAQARTRSKPATSIFQVRRHDEDHDGVAVDRTGGLPDELGAGVTPR